LLHCSKANINQEEDLSLNFSTFVRVAHKKMKPANENQNPVNSELGKALSLKTQLDALRPIGKEQEAIIMQKLRLDWNYHSNHLEGNSLTFGETKALILFGITAQGKPLKDHFEITGHDEAVKWVTDIVKGDYPLTESFIRELHTLLLKEPYQVDAITPDGLPTKKTVEVGKYKSQPNHVKTRTGEIFRFATPEETPALMSELVEWYRKKKKQADINPVIFAAEFHYKLIRIHPFDDGNGRVARILMNFILMQFGYPPVIIKTDDKANYFSALQQADSGTIEPFIEYIGKNLNRSLEIMIAGAKGESIEEPEDIDKEIALLEQKVRRVGEVVESLKSDRILLEIFDNTVVPTIRTFLESSEKFNKFYINNHLGVVINDKIKYPDKSDFISIIRTLINKNTSNIELFYLYKIFSRDGFKEFDYTSEILFSFNPANYQVSSSVKDLVLDKKYTEQLTTEEINKLVKSEAKRHKEFIEQKLAEAQNKTR
jgi:Fic family protein